MRIERLGLLGPPADVLRRVAAGARREGLPPPAALVGEWFGSAAVIAPSVAIRPVDPATVFGVAPGTTGEAVGGGWIGYLSYPDAGADGEPPRIPEAAGGWTACVLRQDSDACWWFESLTGEPPPGWLTVALDHAVPAADCEIAWQQPDSGQHRAGVLACLEAIAAGEI